MPILENLVVAPLDVNCYLFGDKETGECAIIDPGGEAERIAAAIKRLDLKPVQILLTHAHFDHAGAVAELKRRFEIPAGVGAAETGLLENRVLNGSAVFGFPFEPTSADFTIQEDDEFRFGTAMLRAISTPGHSPAGISFVSDDLVFSGDVLFAGGIGRDDLPGADTDALRRSLERLLALPDETRVFPGHGPSTTIGRERLSNHFLTQLGVARD